jgi:aminoglycoside phosphotransferase (APT) family kinase protein
VGGDRSSDRHLDAGLAATLIAGQFPDDLAQCETRWFAEGWDNELYAVGREWIFRFPKRAEVVPWLIRELDIMRVAVDTFGPLVPRFERVGAPSDAFPYPFVGYRRLPGVGADRVQSADRDGLAVDLGRALTRLHSIDPGRIPPTPGAWKHAPWSARRAELVEMAPRVRPLLGPDLLAKAEPYLTGAVPEPEQDGPRCVIHNDISPDHILVDPRTGRLTGLIDFNDTVVGEPVLDFVGLIPLGGRSFVADVTAHYGLPLGDRFGPKLEWLSRVLTLMWLAEAAADDPAVDMHVAWVTLAFA